MLNINKKSSQTANLREIYAWGSDSHGQIGLSSKKGFIGKKFLYVFKFKEKNTLVPVFATLT